MQVVTDEDELMIQIIRDIRRDFFRYEADAFMFREDPGGCLAYYGYEQRFASVSQETFAEAIDICLGRVPA